MHKHYIITGIINKMHHVSRRINHSVEKQPYILHGTIGKNIGGSEHSL